MSALEKAIKIGKDLDSFLNEHPEIKIRKKNDKIIGIQIPIDADIVVLAIENSKLITLEYIYKEQLHHYSIL